MTSSKCNRALLAWALFTLMATSACSSTFVVVPRPVDQYTATDTLYAIHRGDEVRVTFHFDTIMRVDTVTRVDTAWVEGGRTIIRADELLRVDTVMRVDTVLRVDTLRTLVTDTVIRAETIVRVDTVRVPTTETVLRVDTVMRVDTLRLAAIDTLRLTVTDTLRLTVTDTVVSTVRVPGQRMLFVPPGHYPQAGECRVWIHDLAPGQQQRAAACDALGDIPAGAFVLFGGEAWDFDYDWITVAESDPDAAPPEIIALKRRR